MAMIDRRAARTRRLLHQALLTLIERKGFEAATVQDIIDEADIGRSTFYAHFTGKEDLLRAGFETLRAELAAVRTKGKPAADQGCEPLAFSRALFEHACGYKHTYAALMGGRGGAIAVGEIRRVLLDLVKEELAATEVVGEIPRDLVAQYVVGAFMTVLTWWLERRSEPPLPAELDVIFRQLVMEGVGPAIGLGPPSAPFASPQQRRR